MWRIVWSLLTTCAGLMAIGVAHADEPMIVLSLHDVKFESQPQGTMSPPQVIQLSNIGNAELTINSINITGLNSTEFVETHNCPAAPATLAAGTACEIQVVFKPKTAGDLSANLAVVDNAAGSPQSVTLKGHAGAPAPAVALSPTALAFGSQRVGASSKLQVVLLSNTGSAPLNITSAIRIAGPASNEFHLQAVDAACPDGTGQLAPNTSCSIGIVFAPVSNGPKNAQVMVEDDAAGSPHTVALSGTGS